MTTEEQFKRFNDFKNDEELQTLLQNYEYIIQAKTNKIDVKTYIKYIESYFNSKVSCGTCPASLKKAQSDFERIIFTNLYRKFPYMLYKPNKDILKDTRFVNGMFETLVISSFSIFSDLLQSFENDFVGKRLKIDRVKYVEVCDELIKFNTNRFRYFDDNTIYSDYTKFKSLYFHRLQSNYDTNVGLDVHVVEDSKIKDFNKVSIKESVLYSDDKRQRKIDIVEALELKKQGMTNEQIGAIFGVTKQAVGKLFKANLEKN